MERTRAALTLMRAGAGRTALIETMVLIAADIPACHTTNMAVKWQEAITNLWGVCWCRIVGVMYWDGIFGVNHKCKETDSVRASKTSFLIEVMMMSCSSSRLWDTNFIDSQQLENLGAPLFFLLQLLFSFFGESFAIM